MRARRLAWLLAFISSLVLLCAGARDAAAGTALELLHGWGYNQDFNGNRERTIFTIKVYEPWQYGSLFLTCDITEPFLPASAAVVPNQKGGFDGNGAIEISVKKIAEKARGGPLAWGALEDLALHLEAETTSRIGALLYYGAGFRFRIPLFDYALATVVIRDDWALAGAALQLGAAWQMTFGLGKVTDLVFDGYFSWGVFGEGTGVALAGPDALGRYTEVPVQGRAFFISQPRLSLDIGKLSRLFDKTLYAGVEYQLAWNRYLQQGVSENVPQLMLRWVLHE
ncbi:MAG: hypothetical protein U0441_29100 [Polyangiaceae bacterium]